MLCNIKKCVCQPAKNLIITRSTDTSVERINFVSTGSKEKNMEQCCDRDIHKKIYEA